MKTTHRLRLSLLPGLLIASALAFTACSREDRSEIRADTANAYNEAKATVANAWDDVKDYSYEKKDDFVASSRVMKARMDAEISELRAEYADAKADAKRSAAWDKLTTARTTFDEKMEALGSATSATWEEAKRETIAAWDNLQAAYQDAKD
jgi:hypothetical protein